MTDQTNYDDVEYEQTSTPRVFYIPSKSTYVFVDETDNFAGAFDTEQDAANGLDTHANWLTYGTPTPSQE